MRIMLVDDEQWIVTGLSTIIGRRFPRHETKCYTDPCEALEAMKAGLPDLLITDIRMEPMSGLSLIALAREMGLRYYAVLTGLEETHLLQEAIRLEVKDYLIKPVNKNELFALLERVETQVNRDTETERPKTREELCRRVADGTEASRVAPMLVRFLRESDDAPEELIGLCRDCELDLDYWTACELAVSVRRDEAGAAEAIAAIRSLPALVIPRVKAVKEIVAWTNAHFSEDITLSDAAAMVYLQPNYLTTLFKKEMSVGFVRYLNRLRVEAACRAILKPDGDSFSEIAQKTGFPSPRHFFTTFKRFTGLTPGEFRQQSARDGLVNK